MNRAVCRMTFHSVTSNPGASRAGNPLKGGCLVLFLQAIFCAGDYHRRLPPFPRWPTARGRYWRPCCHVVHLRAFCPVDDLGRLRVAVAALEGLESLPRRPPPGVYRHLSASPPPNDSPATGDRAVAPTAHLPLTPDDCTPSGCSSSGGIYHRSRC